MNRQEAQAAMNIADNPQIDLTKEDIGIFSGFGRCEFAPVYVTLRQVARLMRWQALQLNGSWDAEALNEVVQMGRKRFGILDSPAVRV